MLAIGERRLASLVAFAALAGFTACQDAGPAGDLDGAWSSGGIPSGAYINFSLSTSGSDVMGTGAEYGLLSAPLGRITIIGSRTTDAFTLTIHPVAGASAKPASYAGSVVNGSELHGTWTEAGQSYPLVFYQH